LQFRAGYEGFLKSYDGGKMDGFGLQHGQCSNDQTASYPYVNPQQIAPYWDLAEQYTLGEHVFPALPLGGRDAYVNSAVLRARQIHRASFKAVYVTKTAKGIRGCCVTGLCSVGVRHLTAPNTIMS
jgi:hypothetical protein